MRTSHCVTRLHTLLHTAAESVKWLSAKCSYLKGAVSNFYPIHFLAESSEYFLAVRELSVLCVRDEKKNLRLSPGSVISKKLNNRVGADRTTLRVHQCGHHSPTPSEQFCPFGLEQIISHQKTLTGPLISFHPQIITGATPAVIRVKGQTSFAVHTQIWLSCCRMCLELSAAPQCRCSVMFPCRTGCALTHGRGPQGRLLCTTASRSTVTCASWESRAHTHTHTPSGRLFQICSDQLLQKRCRARNTTSVWVMNRKTVGSSSLHEKCSKVLHRLIVRDEELQMNE